MPTLTLEPRAGRLAERPRARGPHSAGAFVSVEEAVVILSRLDPSAAGAVEELVEELATHRRAVLFVDLLRAVAAILRRALVEAHRTAALELASRHGARMRRERREAELLALEHWNPYATPDELAAAAATIAEQGLMERIFEGGA